MVNVLGRWFLLTEDYRAYTNGEWRSSNRIDVARLANRHCLVGHFDHPGVHLRDRHPQVLSDPRYFLLTFVREPLAVKLSLFRYEKQGGVIANMSLEDHLLTRDNYMASCFPCNTDDVETVLSRYDFIGVTEHIDESLRQLAQRLGRKLTAIPWFNVTRTAAEESAVSASLADEFKRRNVLDYRIYDHALRRLLR